MENETDDEFWWYEWQLDWLIDWSYVIHPLYIHSCIKPFMFKRIFAVSLKEKAAESPVSPWDSKPWTQLESVLKSANKLKDHQTWGKIYLKPDLTKSQREFIKAQEAELKVEAARRNSLLKNGESWEWKIRGRGLQHHLAKVTIRD